MTDNGTLIDGPTLERLAKIKKLTINFSLDGPIDVHDAIRGEGRYEQTTKTIKRLVGLRGKNSYPAIKIHTTMSPPILGKLDGFIKEAQTFGIDAIKLSHIWFTNQEIAEAHEKELERRLFIKDKGIYSHVSSVSKEYVKALVEEIAAIKHIHYKTLVFVWPDMTPYETLSYYNDLGCTKHKTCMTPWDSVFIRANGDVMFCPDQWITKYKIGNIKDSSLKDLWNNQEARFFRSVVEQGLFPGCARCNALNTARKGE